MLIRNSSLIVFGHRIHHYAFGLALIAAGLAFVLDDRKDFMDWVIRP